MGELDAKLWFTFAQAVAELSCLKPAEVMRRLRAGEIPSQLRDSGDGHRVRMVHRDDVVAVLEAQPLPKPARTWRDTPDWGAWKRSDDDE